MGKVSKWFRSLLSSKRPENYNVIAPNTDAKLTPSRRWSFSRSTTNRNHPPSPSIVSALPQFESKDRNDQQQAIAAAEGWLSNVNREYQVVVKIQSHFRAYLARKALRALKGLVRLQALVRGHIVRKQIAERLLQMQAALRARTRARALRAQIYESSQSAIKPSPINYLGPATPENSEHDIRRSRSSKHEQPVMLERNGSISNSRIGPDKEKMNFYYSTDEGSEDRVYTNIHSFTTSKDSTHRQAILSQSSGEDQSLSPLKFTNDVDKASFCTAETSLQFISSKSVIFTRSGPFTPTRSNITKSCHSGFSDYYPSYMSDTESSKAKARSLSASRQKTQLKRSNTANKKFPIHAGHGNMKSSNTQKVPSTFHSNFISKAYPGSGRLDRLGMPLGCNGVGFSGGLLSSY